MNNKNYHLQSLLFGGDDRLESYVELFYRNSHPVYNSEDESIVIGPGQVVDFSTYLNSISLYKWKMYTCMSSLYLNLEIKGKMQIFLVAYYKSGTQFIRKVLNKKVVDKKERTWVQMEYPEGDFLLAAFEIHTFDTCFIYGGEYTTNVQEEHIREVSLHLATTTFKKEDFILPNLELLKKKILLEDEYMSEHFWIHVIDNGRTLPIDELEEEHIQIHPNPNTGGAGGFTRGMIEALNHKDKATHVLLMDDDVTILPESIRRTFYMLKILRPEYKDYYISGAMLYYEEMFRMYEDTGYLHRDGSYGPLKYSQDVRWINGVINADQPQPQPENAYAGWWYCCIPTTVINMENLPLPVFIRGDDVEYSIRNHAKFITLNGICVWHMGFTNKFNAAMELYQVHRNSLMVQAVSGVGKNVDFMKRISRQVRIELLRFNYQGADLLLDAVEDYMKGYKFFKKNMGEKIMKEKSAKNEQLLPLSEFPEAPAKVWSVYDREERGLLETFLFRITYNGHLWPTAWLKKETGIAAYDWFYSPHRYFFRRKLLVINPHFQTGAYREINKKEFFRIIMRRRRLYKKYDRIHERLEADYRAHKKEMTSEKFWRQYLQMDK